VNCTHAGHAPVVATVFAALTVGLSSSTKDVSPTPAWTLADRESFT